MFAKINGTKLFFDVEGSSIVPVGDKMIEQEACFILHGGPGSDHTYFRPWLSPMAKHMQLIYVDHRGNGRSERTDPTTYSIEQMADDLEELRKYLGLGQVFVLGNSFGGMLAQVYATRYTKSVKKLILVTTTPSADFWDEAQTMADKMATAEQKKVLPDLFEGRVRNEEELDEWWKIMLPLYFHNKDENLFAEMGGRMITALDVSNFMFANEIPNYDVKEQLKELKTDTLVIGAKHDWVTPLNQAELIHELLPNSELFIFNNSGHMPFIEEQELFNQKVLDFVNKKPITQGV
ncbi:alpha/beta fold hydrolase [Virgibacillus byunsanensis]|uniref:Alpha/beta fold hydrolase n=1 Tax=Virgibacillus byunsanensis TaxID=570945 RepID=A0ABW3LNN3_9BACI